VLERSKLELQQEQSRLEPELGCPGQGAGTQELEQEQSRLEQVPELSKLEQVLELSKLEQVLELSKREQVQGCPGQEAGRPGREPTGC